MLALAHPEVAFTLESNGRTLIDVAPAPHLHTRVADLWGADASSELIPVAWRGEPGTISGLVERPHAARSAGRRGYLFVNGRAFSDRQLVRAVDRGYHTTIPTGIRPSFFLFLDVADGAVDVNVHPTKAEVRFRDGGVIEASVEAAVRSALQPLESVPALGGREVAGRAAGLGMYAHGPSQPQGIGASADTRTGDDGAHPPVDQMSLFVSGTRSTAPVEGEEGESGPGPGEIVRPVMWQVHNTYIFAETRDGLVIVDQHAAHERVLYERLMREWEQPEARDAQRLLFPLTLRLSLPELDTVEQLSGLFTRIGYEIEEFGSRAVVVHAVPNPHPHFDAERCLRDMLRELTEGSELVAAARNQHERLALSFACKGAIKAGQPLSDREISELFDQLFATELPYHDIHGRPTVVQLSMNELHNRFRRSG